MNWTQTFDNYCERLGPQFWAEPVNAATNLSFILAAFFAVRFAIRDDKLDVPVAILIVITAMVGIGSFLFHTFATLWALLADVIPIQLFIIAYFALAMRRFAQLSWWLSVAATVAFVLGSYFAGNALEALVGNALNNSEGYIPPLVALIVVGALLVGAGRTAPGRALIIAGVIFAVSLTFRSVDMTVCNAFPLGTHFLWHTFNGLLLGWLLYAMIRHGTPHPRQSAD